MGTSELSTSPSNEAIASASVTDNSSSQSPAGKTTPANSLGATRVPQRNTPPVVSFVAFAAFLPVPLSVPAVLAMEIEQPTLASVASHPATGVNAADTGTTAASQIPQGTLPGFAALLPTTQPPANPSLSATLPGYGLTSPSTSSGKEAAATQPISLSLQPSLQPLTSDSAQPPIMEANWQEQISSSVFLPAQRASSLAAAQTIDPPATAVAASPNASFPDMLTAAQLTVSAGADALPSAIPANPGLVPLRPQGPTDMDDTRSSSTSENPVDRVPDLPPPAIVSLQSPPAELKPSSSAAPQPSPVNLSAGAGQNPLLPPTLLGALHNLVNNALPRSANQMHATPPQSDAPPPTTQPMNSSFSVFPTPSPAQKISLSAEPNFSLGSNAGPSTMAASSFLPSTGVPATGSAENNSQSDTSGGDTTDPSLHKGLATPSAQSAGLAPTSPQPGVALPDPALQAATQGTTQSPVQGTIQGAIQATIQTTGGAAATGPAAHKSEIGGAAPSDSPSTLPSPAEPPVPTSAGPVQMAQMVSKAAQSEMRIALNTAAFGNVEVHTMIHANEVGVQIGSEKGDLRSLLANDLPGIANTLQQQNLRLNQVNFHQQGFAFSNQMSSGGGDSQSRNFAARSPATSALSGEVSGGELGEAAQPLPAADVRGLSVLA